LKLKPWQGLVLAVCAVVFAAVFYRGRQVAEGQKAFERLGCQSCHMAGGAPSLAQVGRKYDRRTLVDWLNDPETVYARLGRKPLNPGYVTMPRQPISRRDIERISYFLSAQR
jgi:mono/diheme cytochrome c family protein